MLLPRCSLPPTSKTQLISERDGGAKGPMPDELAGYLLGKTQTRGVTALTEEQGELQVPETGSVLNRLQDRPSK